MPQKTVKRKPCKLCAEPRIQGKGYCAAHHAERKRQWDRESYRRHKKERLHREAEYRAKPEVKAQKAAYSKVYAPRWRAKNDEKAKAAYRRDRHRRRSMELGAAGVFTEEQWQARLAYFGWCCWVCGCDWKELPSFYKTIDHIIPLSKGGSNWPANLRPACKSCNSIRKAKAA